MASLAYDRRALEDLDRISDFLILEDASSCEEALLLIHSAINVLQSHPLIGRMIHGDLRELVISHGKSGYIALYHFRKASEHVQVRGIRHQREAGFED
jgi:plasmid stabilization system protein ParE